MEFDPTHGPESHPEEWITSEQGIFMSMGALIAFKEVSHWFSEDDGRLLQVFQEMEKHHGLIQMFLQGEHKKGTISPACKKMLNDLVGVKVDK